MILVDTRQISRIGKFSEIVGKPGVEVHIYDHHPPSPDDIHGSLEMIDEVGSNTTLLLRLLQEREIEISPDEATVMMLGIYEDTGNLTFPSAKEDDFKAAGYLVRKGANLNILSNVITKELTAEQVFLLNDLIQSASRFHVHGTEVVIAQAASDRYIGDIAVLAQKLMDMENLDVLFVLVRMEDRVYLIGRSREEEVNVAEVASEFDNNTGLVWEQSPAALLPGPTWIDARLQCFEKNVGGSRGWRLPSVVELASLIDTSLPPPFVPAVFTGVQLSSYWSATTNVGTSNAWTVGFDQGHAGWAANVQQ